jgi:hypothetical protein
LIIICLTAPAHRLAIALQIDPDPAGEITRAMRDELRALLGQTLVDAAATMRTVEPYEVAAR